MVISTTKVSFPATIGKKRAMIHANVVHNNIPLLLSKESMKKANTVIDFNSDKAVMFSEEVQLYSTNCCHYCFVAKSKLSANNKFHEEFCTACIG